MSIDYRLGDQVVWGRTTHDGANWVEEPAIVITDEGKDRVEILCLDGRERRVKKSNVQYAGPAR